MAPRVSQRAWSEVRHLAIYTQGEEGQLMMEVPKKCKPMLIILFNFLVQLISKKIFFVNNQELRFFHTNHGGLPYRRTQKTHFLLGGQGQRQVRATSRFLLAALPTSFLLSSSPPHPGNLSSPDCSFPGPPCVAAHSPFCGPISPSLYAACGKSGLMRPERGHRRGLPE